MTWKELEAKVGRDPIATLTWLYVDELAQEAESRASEVGDPVVLFNALADETGTIDPDTLNNAEKRAVARYNQEYQWLLGEITDAQWEQYRNLLYALSL